MKPTSKQPGGAAPSPLRRRLAQGCAMLPLALAAGAMPLAHAAGRGRFRVFVVIHRQGSLADEGFMEHLKNAGLDIEFIVRNIDGDVTLLPGIVDEIKQRKPDLIYTQSTQVTVGIAGAVNETDAARFVRDIPIVFSMVADPVKAQLVRRLEQPERNLTGAIHVVSLPVQLKAMQAYLPIKRLGILFTPNEKTQRDVHEQLRKLARPAGIEVVSAHPLGADGLPDVKQLAPMLDRMAALKPDLVYIPPVNFFGPHSDYLMQEALARKLPTFCAIEVQVKSGGLMGLVAPFYNVGALAGYKAEQILLGKMAVQKTPIEVLSRFSYMVNMPTARALGLYPPMQILRFAQIIGA